jgi:type II secretory pathway component PulK
MQRLTQSRGRRRGSALLAVFWGVIVLSMAIGGWFYWLQERMRTQGEDARAVEALAMAHSGVAMAMNPGVDRYSSLLQADLGAGKGFRVEIEGEGGRLNLQWILSGEDGRRQRMFRLWLETVIGVDLKDRDRLVDCLLDYVDPDNLVRLNGDEGGRGEYRPANRMFLSLEELQRVPGIEPLLAYPDWKNLFTMESTGPVDLMEAPEGVLRVLPGFGEAQIQRLLNYRVGMDGVHHTEDDPKVGSVKELLMVIGGISPQAAKQLEGLVTANDQTFRIKSEGYSGKVVRQVQVVVRKGVGTPQIRSWIE